MLVFLRSTDCHPDSRLQKYTDYMEHQNKSYHVVGWDRYLKVDDNDIYTYYHREAKHGQGVKNLLSMFFFNWFVFRYLWRHRNEYNIIHACDFDTIMPAVIMKLLFHKSVIYDIFDWFVDSRNFNNKILKSIILSLERFCLKRADVVIICDEERTAQLNHVPEVLWVLPNIPHFNQSELQLDSIKENQEALALSYVGVLSDDRGIDNLLEVVKMMPNIKLSIAGFGVLESKVKEYSEKYENIHFYGSVPYPMGLKIMNQSDIIVAFYEKKIKNNIYAAPNKYYESLFLKKPLLTTAGTAVGNKVEKYRTGFAIEEDMNSLKTFLSDFSKNDAYFEMLDNASALWNKQYVKYVDAFMHDYYLKFIK